jgi:hypothetical protein
MEINKAVLDELIKDYKKPEDLIGETGLLKQLTGIRKARSGWLSQREFAQRKHGEDGKRRVWRNPRGDAAGSQCQL